MDDIDLDWYTYLTEGFKLKRASYKTSDRAVVDCPSCGKTDSVRINHLKAKIKKLGYYKCSKCRKSDGIKRARAVFKEKHNGKNPFELESVKAKIKETNLKNHGVECILSKPEVHLKGIKAAAQPSIRRKAKKTMMKNHESNSNLCLNRDKVNDSLKDPKVIESRKTTNVEKYGVSTVLNLKSSRDTNKKVLKNKAKHTRLKWELNSGKICILCKRFKDSKSFTTIENSKCKPCLTLYRSEYSKIRKSLRLGISYASDLNCSHSKFSDYIESQFKPGMSWDNWSINGWHLDHIIPISKITDKNKSIINNYRNFQPLKAKDNRMKSSKTPKVIIIAGCFGSGKSTISGRLKDEFPDFYDVYDKDKRHDIYDVGKTHWEKTAIYQISMKTVGAIKQFKEFFEVEVIVIQEEIEVIESRIAERNGKFNEKSISNRIKRMKSIAKNHGDFTGTANECFEYLIRKALP